ncbi:MAG: hemerythrin domain-containing protein [Dehalococcoidia bacterium]|nr:hemerythrin domain-containing protein [Dehalococcoidia bacterium]
MLVPPVESHFVCDFQVDEHRVISRHLQLLLATVESIGKLSDAALRQHLGDISYFLIHYLVPHIHAADHVLYPAAAPTVGASEVVVPLLKADNAAIIALAQQLESFQSLVSTKAPTPAQLKLLRGILYSLYICMEAHISKEEAILLPLLPSQLTPEEYAHLQAEIAKEAKSVSTSRPVRARRTAAFP